MKKRNSGITLVALVITIIVLIILAGVSINAVMNQGLITNAKNARDEFDKSKEDEKIILAIAEAEISSYNEQTGMTEDEIIALNLFDFTDNEYKGNVAKVVDEVPIPLGFVHVEGTTKEEGLIIVDKSGNEFVWVPAENGLTYTEYDESVNPSDGNGTTDGIPDEYVRVQKSVKTYKGFYVGRYETGGFNSDRVVSKSGENQESCTNKDWYTMYTMQKALYGEETDSVESGMIFVSQVNAMYEWMSDIENPNVVGEYFINNATGMGHTCYEDCSNPNCDSGIDETTDDFECKTCNATGRKLITENEAPILTGSNDKYKVKNIYDTAGNYYEWTMGAAHVSADWRISVGYSYKTGWEHSKPLAATGYCEASNKSGEFSSRIQLHIR